MKICTHCGLGHDDGAVHCRRCGEALEPPRVETPAPPPAPEPLPDEQVRLCPRCGLSNPADAPFCRDCNASLTGIRPVSERELAEKASRGPLRRTYWHEGLNKPLAIACGVGFAAGLVSLFFIPVYMAVGALLLCGIAALGFLFPELDFRLRVMQIAWSAEPSDWYYATNFIGSVVLLLMGIGVLVAGWFLR